MKVLISDLLCTEVWKSNVYPLLKNQLGKINSVRAYMTVSVMLLFLEFSQSRSKKFICEIDANSVILLS